MPKQPQPAPFDGALVIDKPPGKTSHDVVDAVRHLAGFRQIGHLGTLDPLATGVLVLLLGRATRLVQFYTGRRKRYTAGFRFGFATDTYDSDGEAQGPDAAPVLDGAIARFNIECSSGTYIRSLAHEMGQKLGCGAHLAEITRTAVGEFSLEQAIALEELAEAKQAGKFADCMIPLESLLPNFPRVNVLPVIEKRVRHGSKFNISIAQLQPGRVDPPPGATTQLDGGEPKPPRLRVFGQQEKLIAIAEAVVPRTYQPIVVFESLP